MAKEQYVQHDWPPYAWALMLLGMVVLVTAMIGLFLYMVQKASNVTGAPAPAQPAGELEAADSASPAAVAAPVHGAAVERQDAGPKAPVAAA
ncbi:hypothetical protein [Nocardioides dilutus]